MKVQLKNIRKDLRPNQVGIVQKFVNFLQENAPSKEDLLIVFQSKRGDQITTGKETDGSLFVFTKSRVLIDILRTLAHEWVHALQNQNMKTEPTLERASEDHANSVSGFLVKKFVKEYPEVEVEIYKD